MSEIITIANHEGKVFSLENSFLYEDGSILLGDKRVYSLR